MERFIASIKAAEARPANHRQGKHENRPDKMADDRLHDMAIFGSFPVESMHYSRQKNGNGKYLNSTINHKDASILYGKIHC